MGQNVLRVNVRQANGIGKVHAAKPQIKETYCGRALNEEEWLITSKEVTCTGCTRAGRLIGQRGQGEVPNVAGVLQPCPSSC